MYGTVFKRYRTTILSSVRFEQRPAHSGRAVGRGERLSYVNPLRLFLSVSTRRLLPFFLLLLLLLLLLFVCVRACIHKRKINKYKMVDGRRKNDVPFVSLFPLGTCCPFKRLKCDDCRLQYSTADARRKKGERIMDPQ